MTIEEMCTKYALLHIYLWFLGLFEMASGSECRRGAPDVLDIYLGYSKQEMIVDIE